MPDWLKGRDQTKNSPWSSRLGVGRQADNPLQEKKDITETETRITTAPYWEAGVQLDRVEYNSGSNRASNFKIG